MANAALRGKPDAGNPHVRFDEGEVASCTEEASLRRVPCRRQPEGSASGCAATPRRGSLLYKGTQGKGLALGRREFLNGALFATLAATSGCSQDDGATHGGGKGATGYSLNASGNLCITVPGVREGVRVFHVTDTHLPLHDSRDDAYAGNYARMSHGGASREVFSQILAKAKAAKADLVALTGDIISFPTLANVEFVAEELRKSGLDWIYTAGNHDWHFEGVPGSDAAQREEWIPKRILPLYCGDVDPFAHSKVVKGIRFVAIDNSIYHVTERQLSFWRSEIAKGDPTVLLMHIPLWMDGFDIDTCGNPNWGAATDRFWEIERREKWAERQSAESFALRSEVLAASNLVAVLTGHIHRWLSASKDGRLMFAAPHGKDGFACDVRIVPAF